MRLKPPQRPSERKIRLAGCEGRVDLDLEGPLLVVPASVERVPCLFAERLPRGGRHRPSERAGVPPEAGRPPAGHGGEPFVERGRSPAPPAAADGLAFAGEEEHGPTELGRDLRGGDPQDPPVPP